MPSMWSGKDNGDQDGLRAEEPHPMTMERRGHLGEAINHRGEAKSQPRGPGFSTVLGHRPIQTATLTQMIQQYVLQSSYKVFI